MNIVVIGLGSMGKRRIRLLKKFNSDFKIFGVDSNLERQRECSQIYMIECFKSLDDLLDKVEIQYAFVCTAPLSHGEIITRCLNDKMHVFTELNLVDDYYEMNIKLARENNLVLFMSSTFLYRDEVKRIKEFVEVANCQMNYTYHSGQYLPDWHPWENYNDFFVGEKRTNGCREIFAIELPWLVSVFGKIVEYKVLSDKISDLNIQYNDNYLVLLKHDSGNKGVIAVDVISRKATRNLEVFGEAIHLTWDGTPKGLKQYNFDDKMLESIEIYQEVDQLKDYSSVIVENAYTNEIEAFFESVRDGKEPIYSFEQDQEILKLIDKIEG